MFDEPKVGGEILVDGKVRTVRAVITRLDGSCAIGLEPRDGEVRAFVINADGEIE